MSKWFALTLASVALHGAVLLGCPRHPVVPDAMKADADAIVVVTPDLKAECEAACTRLESLGCPEAKPAANGESCVKVCRRVASFGFLSPGCVANAHNKDELARCQVRCVE